MGCWQAALRSAGASLAGVAVPSARLLPLLLHLLCPSGAFGRLAGPFGCEEWGTRSAMCWPQAFRFSEVLLNFFQSHLNLTKPQKRAGRAVRGVPFSQVRDRKDGAKCGFLGSLPRCGHWFPVTQPRSGHLGQEACWPVRC